MAGTYNITIEQGATFSKRLIYKDSAGVPIDLSDVSEVRAQMRPTVDSSSYTAFTVEVDDDPETGIIHWSMNATTTAGITSYSQVYDLEIEFSSGEVRRLLQGTVTVSREVTRAIV